MKKPERTSVLGTEEHALAMIEDGMTIAIGGFNTASHPMTLVRGIIRKGVRNLTVIGSTIAGLEIDMLIGAGCVKKVVSSSVTGEAAAPIGPFFRMMAEKGEIEVWESDEGILYAMLRAASQGLPFMPWKAGVGTSLPEVNPDLKLFEDPFTGEPLLAVKAMKPEICILHVQQSDDYGLGQHEGSGFGDRALHWAADKTIIQVEKIVPNEEIRKDPLKTSIAYADMVVRASFGAHPFSSPGYYLVDEKHLAEYVEAAEAARKGNWKPWDKYLQYYIMEPKDHIEYLERVGSRQLFSLYEY